MTARASTEAARASLNLLHAGILQAQALAIRAAIAATVEEAKATTLWKDRSGDTRRSIHGEVFRTSGTVTAGGASRWLEDGTVPHLIVARNAKALCFVTNGGVVFRKWVHHPGTKPTHFMERAARRGEQALDYGVSYYVGEAIRRAS